MRNTFEINETTKPISRPPVKITRRQLLKGTVAILVGAELLEKPNIVKAIDYLGSTFETDSTFIEHNGFRTEIVGKIRPIDSFSALDSIEKDRAQKEIPELETNWIIPRTQEEGQEIQKLRLRHWREIGGKKTAALEFIISARAREILEDGIKTLRNEGFDIKSVEHLLLVHVDALNDRWNNSLPNLERRAVAKRITYLGEKLLSEEKGGWQVKNDTTFGWWANGTFNGIPRFIPYDIDYRVYVDDNFARGYIKNARELPRKDDIPYDANTLHEISHLFPIGDHFTWNFVNGSRIAVPLLGRYGVNYTYFPEGSWGFMPNDHMSSPNAEKMTAPGSYYIKFLHRKYPYLARMTQFNAFYHGQEIKGHDWFFYPNLTVRIEGLEEAGISKCVYMRQVKHGGPLEIIRDKNLLGMEIDYREGVCSLSLSSEVQRERLHYVGLVKNGIIFPVYLANLLMQTMYWEEYLRKGSETIMQNQRDFTLHATERFPGVLDHYYSQIKGSLRPQSVREMREDIPVRNTVMTAYFDTKSDTLPKNSIFYGPIDSLGNNYFIDIDILDRHD